MIGDVNPRVQLYHVTPMNMRLNDDLIDELEERVGKASTSNHALRKVRRPIDKSAASCRRSQGPMVVGNNLTTVEVKNRSTVDKSSAVVWELSHVMVALKKLFPHATMPPIVSDLWSVPENTNSLKGFNRILEISSIKLLTARQYDEGRAVLNSSIDTIMITRPSDIESVINGILSVHGLLRVRNRGTAIDRNDEATTKFKSAWVHVEACRGSIKVKPVDDIAVDNVNVLTVLGTLTSSDASLLQSIFDCCYIHRLRPMALLDRTSVTVSHMLKMQDDAVNVPLPDGWCFDGAGYIDGNSMKGTRHQFRPDINVFVDKYLAVKNQEVVEFNNVLQQYRHFL